MESKQNQKMKVLVTAELVREMLEPFAERCNITYAGYAIDREVMPQEELKKQLKGVEVLVCEYDTISKDVLDAADKLRLIVCCRGGVKSVVDLDAAKERGIVVRNTAGRNAAAVAELVVAFMLDMTRKVTLTTNLIHNRVITQDLSTKPSEYQDTVWGLNNDSPFVKYRGRSLKYMTIGLVGCGFTGQEVAKRLKAFGAKIIGCDPYAKQEALGDLIELVDFETLIRESDIISLHCPVTSENKGLFNAELFSKMKRGSYFINSARGGLVNESDLVKALNDHVLSGAAIDVTVKEPISSDSELLSAENLIITPHIAGSTDDVQIQGTQMVVDYLKEYLA